MTTSIRVTVVALFLGLAGLMLYSAACAAAPGAPVATPGAPTGVIVKARPTVIMVVDVQEVLKKSDERKAVEANYNTQVEKVKDDERVKVKELNEMQDALDKGYLQPGTEAWKKEQERLEQKAIELQAWRAYQNAKATRERVTQMEYMYNKILQAVAKAAKDRGADLVLFKEPAVDFREVKPEAVSAIIQVRKVLYAADDLDLTTPVVQDMNNAYNSGPKATTRP